MKPLGAVISRHFKESVSCSIKWFAAAFNSSTYGETNKHRQRLMCIKSQQLASFAVCKPDRHVILCKQSNHKASKSRSSAELHGVGEQDFAAVMSLPKCCVLQSLALDMSFVLQLGDNLMSNMTSADLLDADWQNWVLDRHYNLDHVT